MARASSGIEGEVVDAAEQIEIAPSITIPVARGGHLVAMKRLSRNDRTWPQDYDDAFHLASDERATQAAA